MKDSRMIFFVSTPDSYFDVFYVFLQCFKKFCVDCPYNLVVATNTKKYDGIKVYLNNNPGDSWYERTIPVIKNINAKYILLMDDDIFITDYINYIELENILNQMDKYNIKFCGLNNFLHGKKLEKDSLLVRVNKRSPYAKNLQVGIFERDYLIHILNDNADGHIQESEWLKEAYYSKNEYYKDIVSCKKNVLHCVHGVYKGKWSPIVIKKLKKLGISVISDRETHTMHSAILLKIVNRFGKMLNPKLRRVIKLILKKLNFNFVTEY